MEVRRPSPEMGTRVAGARASAALCSTDNTLRVFERGFLELLSDGQAQASAQVLRVCIGEPGMFTIPVYFLAGTSGGAVGSPRAKGATAAELLNPIGGNLSASVAGDVRLRRWGRYTSLGLAYHLAGRYLHARDTSESGVPLFAGSGYVGLRFQTGAWDLADPANAGIAWAQVTLAASAASGARLRRVLGAAARATTASVTVDVGLDIAGKVNAKLAWSHVLDDHGIAALRDPPVRVGLDFRPAR